MKKKEIKGHAFDVQDIQKQDAIKSYRPIMYSPIKMTPRNIVAEHLKEVISYNTDTPAHFRPDNVKMRRLGFMPCKDNRTFSFTYNGKKQTQCAYTANRLSSMFRQPTAGNAWTTQGIYGDSIIIDGYRDGFIPRPPFYFYPAVDLYNRSAAIYVKKNISKHHLVDGDIVGMYTTVSPSQRRAYREGRFTKRTNTHTGRIVTGLNGAPFVVHNMHGEVRLDPLSDLLGGFGSIGITYISRPVKVPDKGYRPSLKETLPMR